MLRQLKLAAIAVTLVTSPALAIADDAVDYDTTRVREVEPVRKSTGETIADIPGELLKLPVYVIEGTAWLLSTNPPLSLGLGLIKIGGEAAPYVPIVGYGASSGVKFGFGLKMLNTKSKDGQLKFKWYYSTHDYQSYQLQYRADEVFDSPFNLDLYSRYKKRPRESFYGVGMQSDEEREVSYGLEDTEFRVRLTRQASHWGQFSVFSRYRLTNVFDGRDPGEEGRIDTIVASPVFALDAEQFDAMRHIDVGVSLEIDRRNHKGQPTRGSHLLAQYDRVFGVGQSSDRNYDRYSVDFRHYLMLWRKRVLAVRAYFSRIDATASNQQLLPFYLAGQLGGLDGLRSYTRGRFIDNDLALVSAEYRYPIFDVADAFLFWEEGRVFRSVSQERVLNGWRHSAGFGVRVWNEEGVLAVVQIATGEEETRFYFELGATW